MNLSRRHLFIAGGVVLFHAAALWALQSGLVRRAVELVVPVVMVSEIITPAPKVEPPTPVPAPAPEPAPKPVARKVERPRPAPPAPQPVAVASPSPAPSNAPLGVQQPQPPAPPVAAPVAAPAAAPAAPAKVELPSSDAAYLQNPPAVYPPMSKRLGEQGTVIVHVVIGADGLPQKADIRKSSGFERLDRAAIDYVMKCRYVPGKVGGVPQTMGFDAPVKYNLD